MSHADIREIYTQRTIKLGAIVDFVDSGAIRFARRAARGRESSYAQFSRIPNERQIYSLKKAVRETPSLSLDFLEPEMGKPKYDLEGRPVALKMEIPAAGDIDRFINWAKSSQKLKKLNFSLV